MSLGRLHIIKGEFRFGVDKGGCGCVFIDLPFLSIMWSDSSCVCQSCEKYWCACKCELCDQTMSDCDCEKFE